MKKKSKKILLKNIKKQKKSSRPFVARKSNKKISGKKIKVVKKVKKSSKPKSIQKSPKKIEKKKAGKLLQFFRRFKTSEKKVKKVSRPVVRTSKKNTPKKVKVSKVKVQPSKKSTPSPQVEEVVMVSEPVMFQHQPVLLEEIREFLELPGKKVIVDGTLGLGGHAREILALLPKDTRYIGFELDQNNLQSAQKHLEEFANQVSFINSNFNNLTEELKKLNIKGIDALLLDLGLSSPQVDDAERGFSFLREGPLDMRFDKSQDLTAAEVVNKYSEKELTRIFKEYGEEMKARKIAQEIVKHRRNRPFKTTVELANFIEKLLKRQGHIHPATRVFQALRIEVNKELDVLHNVLLQAVDLLKKEGRLAVIAYHSLEDRIVKNFLKEHARDFINIPGELTTTHLKPKLKIITKKPVVPGSHELSKNPRSRSAKLRVAEKI